VIQTLGGHITSFSSAATFNISVLTTFFRGNDGNNKLIWFFFQGPYLSQVFTLAHTLKVV